LFKKILVPIDGSKSADKALDFALDLAKKYSAEIKIITVFDEPSPSLLAQGTVFVPSTTENYLEKARDFHKKTLIEAKKKAKKVNPKIKVSQNLLTGRPADTIVEKAQKEEFDLIVMGSRGLGGIKELLLGSVSDRVADRASCPVLIVKNETDK
jgi:nucleotide-binding universal stress UspA family protein